MKSKEEVINEWSRLDEELRNKINNINVNSLTLEDREVLIELKSKMSALLWVANN